MVCPDLMYSSCLSSCPKSLVVADDSDASGATRFSLLETIRQYARDKLLERGAAEQVRDRHLKYYLEFVEANEPNFFGPHRLEWMDRCELEHDNFRAACSGFDHDLEAAPEAGRFIADILG
jgi:predicted ATPase